MQGLHVARPGVQRPLRVSGPDPRSWAIPVLAVDTQGQTVGVPGDVGSLPVPLRGVERMKFKPCGDCASFFPECNMYRSAFDDVAGCRDFVHIDIRWSGRERFLHWLLVRKVKKMKRLEWSLDEAFRRVLELAYLYKDEHGELKEMVVG